MKLSKELTTVTTFSKIIALLFFVTLPILTFVFGINYQRIINDKTIAFPTPTEEVSCTEEAKICPDGSSVSRIPPDCKFEECPLSQGEGKKFTGLITSINYNCHMDGMCGIGVGKSFIIIDSGESLNSNETKGTVPDGLLDENKKNEFIGKNVEVYAKNYGGITDSYTLFGSSDFYIKLVNDFTAQTFCGGIAGKTCPTGYYCKYDGTYPDAGGTCVKEQTTKKFNCPKNDYVDCMPGPDRKNNIECSSEFLQWAQKNCPNFKGAAY